MNTQGGEAAFWGFSTRLPYPKEWIGEWLKVKGTIPEWCCSGPNVCWVDSQPHGVWLTSSKDPCSNKGNCFYAGATYVQTFLQNFQNEKHPRQNGSLRHSARNVVKDLGVQLQVSLRFLHCGRFIYEETWETLNIFITSFSGGHSKRTYIETVWTF